MSDDLQLPPNAPEAEQGMLACIMDHALIPGSVNPLPLILERGAAGLFFDGRCSTIWAAMKVLHESRTPIDTITLFDLLRKRDLLAEAGGVEFITSIQDKGSCSANWEHYYAALSRCASARNVIKLCVDHQQRAMDGDASVDALARESANLREETCDKTSDVDAPADNAEQFATDVESRVRNKDTRTGVVTGFIDFDELTDGLQFGDLAILGARPSVGKTSWAMNVVDYACLRHGVPTLVITYESSPASLRMRLAAMHSGVTLSELKRGKIDATDMPKLTAFNLRMRGAPLFFLNCVSHRLNAVQLRSTYKRLCETHGIRLAVVDYLQKVPASRSNEKRTYEVAEVATELKAMADETKTAVLALAQVNRESEKARDKEGKTSLPHLPDLKDSGHIEQEADVVAFLHRQRDESQGPAKLVVAKQRDGATGIVELNFDGRFCRFTNATKDQP